MKLNILYCEDDPDLREVIIEHLESNIGIDIHFIESDNGIDAYKNFLTHKEFSFILSDYDMGRHQGDGISFYKKVRENNKDIKFVLLTSMPKENFSEFFNDPNFFFISKSNFSMGINLCNLLKEKSIY